MRRKFFTIVLFISVLIVSDLFRARAETFISEVYANTIFNNGWLTQDNHYLFTIDGLYLLVYGAVGLIFGAWFRRSTTAFCFTLLLCTCTFAQRGFEGALGPIMWDSHATWWSGTLSWGNWFIPPLAGVCGTLLWNVRKKKIQQDT